MENFIDPESRSRALCWFGRLEIDQCDFMLLLARQDPLSFRMHDLRRLTAYTKTDLV